MLLRKMLEIRYYVALNGHEPFAAWFGELDPNMRARIARAVIRMEQGNLANAKSVGAGVHEYRIDTGPGFRIYFGRDGHAVVILLTGGTKRRQQRDIAAAHAYWQDYKKRK